jgi:DnaJ family protein C protein 2
MAERDAKEAKVKALQKDKPAPVAVKVVEKVVANTKDKEAKKKAAKKEKKLMKDLVKEHEYFCTATLTPEWIDAQLNKLDRVFEKHGDDLEAVRIQLQEAIAKGKKEALAVLDTKST